MTSWVGLTYGLYMLVPIFRNKNPPFILFSLNKTDHRYKNTIDPILILTKKKKKISNNHLWSLSIPSPL